MKETELVIDLPAFGSERDELVLFEWLKQIEAVGEVRGRGQSMYVAISMDKLDREGLRELLAVFRRYGLNMKQLAALDCPAVCEWFHDPKGYWRDQVFGQG